MSSNIKTIPSLGTSGPALMGFHHFKLTVSDLDRSIQFYNRLGMELIYRSERKDLPAYNRLMGYENTHLKIAMLKPADDFPQLALIQYLNPPIQKRAQELYFAGAAAFAIQVRDLDAIHRRLRDAGVPFICEPQDIVREGKLVSRAAYLCDPDLFRIEIYEPLQ